MTDNRLYSVNYIYKLRSFVPQECLEYLRLSREERENSNKVEDEDQLNCEMLLTNPRAGRYIEMYLENMESFPECDLLPIDHFFQYSQSYFHFDWSCIVECLTSSNEDIWSKMCRNPYFVFILELYLQNKDYETYDWTKCRIDWSSLCQNPEAIHLIERYMDHEIIAPEIDWENLSSNPNAMRIIEKNMDKVNWKFLSRNPSAIRILLENQDKIDWKYFNMNPHPKAIEFLEKNPSRIRWQNLSANPSAITLLKNNIHRIDPNYLSHNPNFWMCYEHVADDFQWYYAFANEGIFEIDYEFLRRRMNIIRDELMRKTRDSTRNQE